MHAVIPEFDMELPNSIYSLSFSPNGKFLAVASADQLVRIWDIGNSVFIDTLGGHNTTWMWVKYSPDGKYLISGSRDRSESKGKTIEDIDLVYLDSSIAGITTIILYNSSEE